MPAVHCAPQGCCLLFCQNTSLAHLLHQQETQTQVTEAETTQSNKAKIYIGHEKEDYEGRRTGKPGRFIEDDPTRYPGKEDIGFLAGATGGWAGGEAGLKQFIEEVWRCGGEHIVMFVYNNTL